MAAVLYVTLLAVAVVLTYAGPAAVVIVLAVAALAVALRYEIKSAARHVPHRTG